MRTSDRISYRAYGITSTTRFARGTETRRTATENGRKTQEMQIGERHAAVVLCDLCVSVVGRLVLGLSNRPC